MRMAMTRSLAVAAFVLPVLAPLATAQGPQDDYSCDPYYSNYTACAVIDNQVETFSAPGKVSRTRPLVFLNRSQLPCYWGGTGPYYWDAQKVIPSGGRGDAQINGSLCAGGVFNYGMRQVDGAQNYQAIVGFRVDGDADLSGCITSTFLECRMGPELETGRDSKRVFTVTSRLLEVKVVNTLANPLRRVDGPYWSNALGAGKADNAGTVAAGGGVGYMGAMRSVSGTSAFAAIYKVMPNAADPRFNGTTVAIDVKTRADGTHSGRCTPVYAPSWRPFNCSVDFSGSANLVATVRVRP